MSYGLLTTGFVPKTLEVIRGEINQAFRDQYGSSLDLSDDTPLGKWIGILAERFALLWELAEATYASQDPDQATGAALESICALTGTTREPASASTVTLTLTGTDATSVTTGSQAANQVSGERFTTTADATIVAVDVWGATTAYAAGDRVSNGGNVYQCTVAGTSAGSGGPSGTGTAITDGTVTWRYLGAGAGAVDVAAESANTGAIVGASGDINVIETPVSGWDDVINVLDATLGSDLESDESLRIRREDEIGDAGATTVDAARASLLKIDEVTTVTGFWNHTSTTDSDGVPPHAVEFLIQGGVDQDIFDGLLASVAGGIETYGSTSGTAEDSEGNDHTMSFSRPTEKDIYHAITLEYDAELYPSDGDDQVKAAIVAYGDAQAVGRDVVSSAQKAACFGVPGVIDVSLAYIGLSASPSSETTVPISSRELAVYDTSRITVSSSAGTP